MITFKLTITYKLLRIGIMESRHIGDTIARLPCVNRSTPMADGVAVSLFNFCVLEPVSVPN